MKKEDKELKEKINNLGNLITALMTASLTFTLILIIFAIMIYSQNLELHHLELHHAIEDQKTFEEKCREQGKTYLRNYGRYGDYNEECLEVGKGSTTSHYACYFDNNNTDCGKKRYCPSHRTMKICLDLNGTWEKCDQGRMVLERLYFQRLFH
jgi:hypothetical protein